MGERERLIETLNRAPIGYETLGERLYKSAIVTLADDLLKNGVIVLPVKLGQEVYYLDRLHDTIWIGKIVNIELDNMYNPQTWLTVKLHINSKETNEYKSRINLMLGKTIFLTKEEAEKALKGGVEWWIK